MGAPILKCVKQDVPNIYMDCHMMVSEPERVSILSSSYFPKLLAKVESMERSPPSPNITIKSIAAFYLTWLNPEEHVALIKNIHSKGMKAGVAISPATPSTAITDAIAQAADMLLVMTVEPGQGGQKFKHECMSKVRELRSRFPDKDIEVDGGVTPKNIDECAEAGSNVIVAGTAIFTAEDPADVISAFKKAINQANLRKAL
ncbi:RIBULOSE-phosphate 3-epimerase [Tulasnella sp. 330]|nr:RIBULOSE-phosphate 3-epimerase [Tulasnella sp. 330]